MKHYGREVGKDEALNIAADMDRENQGVVNGREAFRCSECNGFVTVQAWGRRTSSIDPATRTAVGGTDRVERAGPTGS